MAESNTLGEAYAGYGASRRNWMEDRRSSETFGKALEAGADLSFFAAGELEAKDQARQEFETTQNMLGDDARSINLKTGEKWEEKTLLGLGDKDSYLNPFSGSKGLRVGDTLYDETDIAGISQGSEYLALKKGDKEGLANYRENLSSVYGKNIGETKWGKAELGERFRASEGGMDHVETVKHGASASALQQKSIQPGYRTVEELAKGQEDFQFQAETGSVGTPQARNKEGKIIQNTRETTVRQHSNLVNPEIEIGLSPNQKIAKRKADEAKMDEAYQKAYDETYAKGKERREQNPTEQERRADLRRDLEARFFPRKVEQAGREAEAGVRKDWEPLLERQRNLQKMKFGKARDKERESIWEEFMAKSMNNE
jgi:hypothetical protein